MKGNYQRNLKLVKNWTGKNLKIHMNSEQNSPKSLYEAQKDNKWKILTNPLAQNPILHSQLNNLIITIYQKFRQHKNLPKDFKSTIKFQGFQGFQDFPNQTKMGHCDSQLQTSWEILNDEKVEGSETYSGSLSIVLSQKLLLSKLGMDKLISNYQETPSGVKWSELSVNFQDLIGTIAHELAHAYQFLVNEDEIRSQCESTGERNAQGQLKYPQLAYEHTSLTNEIQSLTLKLPEYQKFKNYWEGKENSENILADTPKETKTEKTANSIVKSNPKTNDTPKNPTKEESTNSSQNPKLPSWILPAGITIGFIFLIAIVYWIFKKK